MKTKICVIGAGSGGLSAIKYILENPNLEATVFERAGRIGGVWRYCPHKGTEECTERFPTPMYTNLRMNSPKLCSQLLDFPWPETTSTFPNREEALGYLESYAAAFNLLPHIKFNQQVVQVRPIDPTTRQKLRWNVEVKCLESGRVTSTEFDYVIVCTGHEMEPTRPEIPNLDKFQGSLSTAADYVNPEVYSDKRVLLLGAGPSGLDLALDLMPFAKEVIASFKPLPKAFGVDVVFPAGITTVGKWKSATPRGFIFEDGTELDDIDTVILTTGYDYNYSFLHSECGISIEKGRRVNHLYRHIVNVKFPTMFFIGVSFYGAGFYMHSIQGKWVVELLNGNVKLPDEETMMDDISSAREEILTLGLDEISYAHHVCIQQWKLWAKLAQEGGFETIIYAEKVFNHFIPRMFTCPSTFRKDSYKKIDDNTVEIKIFVGDDLTNSN